MIICPKDGVITKQFLDDNPNAIFVFGDNLMRVGCGGAARFRYHPQALGFITKKAPDYKDTSYYKPDEYPGVFEHEMNTLISHITDNPGKVFYISRIGAGLANKFGIYERVILPGLQRLKAFQNVVIL